MQTGERDTLLFLLAAAAGSADGWSYFGIGHAFVANMTGNTVLLGMSVMHVTKGDTPHLAIAMAGYVLGVVAASLITRRLTEGAVWARSVTAALALEGVILACAEAGWIWLHGSKGSPMDILLACVAFAIGMQSGAMLQLKIPGVVTTYITGTWTTLMNGLALLPTRPEKFKKDRVKFEERLLMQAGVLLVYFLSAVLTGFLFRRIPAAVGAIPCTAVLLVAGYGAVRR